MVSTPIALPPQHDRDSLVAALFNSTKCEPPLQLKIALRCAWTYLLIDLIIRFIDLATAPETSYNFLTVAIWVEGDCVLALITAKISEGRRWARNAFALQTMLGIAFAYFKPPQALPIDPTLILLVFSSAQQWRKPSGAWFNRGADIGGWDAPPSVFVSRTWATLVTFLLLSVLALSWSAMFKSNSAGTFGIAAMVFVLGCLALLKMRQVDALVRTADLVRVGLDSFVLYLREFSVDEHPGGTRYWPRLLPFGYEEEQLVSALSTFGPVVAIAKPNEKLPTLGAHRFKVSHADWQKTVSAFVKDAFIILIRLPKTLSPGISWEILEVTRLTTPFRLLIAIPNTPESILVLRAAFPKISSAVIEEVKSALLSNCRFTSIVGFVSTASSGKEFFVPVVRRVVGVSHFLRRKEFSFNAAFSELNAKSNWRSGRRQPNPQTARPDA